MTDRPKHIVRLTSTPTEREAAVIIAELDEHGIPSTMTGQTTAGFRAEAPGWVQVLVAEEDLARAQQVLAKVRDEQDDVDWSQVDVGEPEDTDDTEDRGGRSRLGAWRRMADVTDWLALAFIALVALFGLLWWLR